MRALIVDDNATNLHILEAQLSSWGMRVDTASDGVTALDRLSAAGDDPYQVAIVDHLMPMMDGLELIRRITGSPGDDRLRIILLTSIGDSRAAARAAGAACSLTKPARPSRLYDAIVTVSSPAAPTVAGSRQPVVPITPGMAILVAEDNEVNQRLAVLILRRRGFTVQVAENGRQAVEMFMETPFVAVLMDCQMPGMNGYEATAEIRRLEAGGPRTPVIAMTANAMTGDRERCLAAGMDDYLAKPLRKAALEKVLARWLPVAPAQPEWIATVPAPIPVIAPVPGPHAGS